MTCHACDLARTVRDYGVYHSDCPECQARSLAGSPAYWKSCALGRITSEYKAALQVIALPDEHFEVTHKRVRQWADHKPGGVKP